MKAIHVEDKSLVVFLHGKESGPGSSKIKRLAEVASHLGFATLVPDFSMVIDPELRLRQFLAMDLPQHSRLVLVGSSMGGYVAAVASEILKPDGLFLMAPAFYLSGYANQNPVSGAKRCSIIAARNDEVIPLENVLRFVRQTCADLHILNSDHRLSGVHDQLSSLFEDFLRNLKH